MFLRKPFLCVEVRGGGNPHALVMLTMRALDEQGKWLPKGKRVYVLDENGERIRLPSGDYKSYKVRTTDWDDPGNCERWRTVWADTTNHCLERTEEDIRIYLRSYERRGVDLVPTVHMGPVVTYLEQQGIRTEIGQYSEEIKQFNRVLQSLKTRLASLKKWLAEAIRKTAEIMKPEPYQPSVMEYIQVFQNLRRSGRADWGKKAKQNAGISDLKFAAQVQFFMEQNDILTLADFEAFVGEQQNSLTQLDDLGKAIQKK
ncbi:MAG: MobA/MobL family protein [Clostridia bacterium]|nr:MobA/MobL family protein [Clostridia bacterium]